MKSKYCAFLRGVNVKGTTMKMAEVCRIFTQNGMEQVTSVLATGNIIFSSTLKAPELNPLLQKSLSDHFNYDAFLFLKTEEEIKNIYTHNPFQKNTDFHIYIFIGSEGIENILSEEFRKSEKSEGEESHIVNGTFYWKIVKGKTLDSDFGKVLGRKNLKDKLTSRNINTLEKIINKF
ncbi:DUF1697 domain-containing protein [Kaistella palustris]|uniref:DUF1697 domain-containing protein n=1 Tax=Kaistella palustris TaxID=493376 RepID=UPI00041524EA|nr:DUF1697 domain-containing protein [Kaistella palustris]